ncbi:MAG: hypothetical protein ABIO46_12940 [Chitinophagales bacterium]
MRKHSFVLVFTIIAEVFFSCKKISIDQSTGDAQWVKVLTDSPVYFPGKIRSDAESNLFCSYNYANYTIDTTSAIIKLDKNGILLWRKEFESLIIYDFVITPGGDAIIASYSTGMMMLTKLSAKDTSTSLLGSYPLPLDPKKIKDIFGVKLFFNDKGNYVMSGTVFFRPDNVRLSMAFLMELDTLGNQVWMQDYFFPEGTVTTVTGCAPTDDGYLLIGNIQEKDPFVSCFFILKCGATGDSSWTKFYETSWFDPAGADGGTYTGYYCYTSDIIPGGGDYFYACAYNEKYNLPNITQDPIYSIDDNSARIFKIDPDGNLIKTTPLKFDFQNMAADLVRTGDNGLLIGFNPINLVGTAYLGKQTSFVARLNADLTLLSVSNIQTHFYDYLGSICVTPDGHYAFETMIQSLGDENYLLEIIKTDENGNF